MTAPPPKDMPQPPHQAGSPPDWLDDPEANIKDLADLFARAVERHCLVSVRAIAQAAADAPEAIKGEVWARLSPDQQAFIYQALHNTTD